MDEILKAKKKQGENQGKLYNEIRKLKAMKMKDFKDAIVEIIIMLNKSDQDGFESLRNPLIDKFKIMDKALDNLFEFKNEFENLRFYLLFQMSRLNVIYNVLKESGMVKDQDDRILNEVWNDDHVACLGYQCTAEELRLRIVDESGLSK